MGTSGQSLFKRALQFPARENRTFIVPTKFGIAFAVTTLILFFFAAGYANNLIYIFVFFLAAIALVGTLATNKNIDCLIFVSSKEACVFARTPAIFEFIVQSRNSEGCFEISARIKDKANKSKSSLVNVPPEQTSTLRVQALYEARGWQPGPLVLVESEFPFGLLRSWRYLRPWQDVLVYPELSGTKEFPQDISEADQSGGFGIFREHKVYSSSEPQNRIDWKASARRSEILVKYFEEQALPSLHFSWAQTEKIEGFEKRVSQLALWINQARSLNRNFTLEIGAIRVEEPQVEIGWLKAMRLLATLCQDNVKQ